MTQVQNSIRSIISDRMRRRAVRRALNRLDERSLSDIGMNRADIDIRFG